MFQKYSCEEFVTALASKDPVPGGGGAAALVGAIGIALGNMVGSLTVGKKKYADVQEDIQRLMTQAEAVRNRFMELIDRDAEGFRPLAEAYRMPGDTQEQKEQKGLSMEAALNAACMVPIEIMQACCRAIELTEEFAEKGSVLALSDAGCAALFCKAALQAASLNVTINTKGMGNRELAESYNNQAGEMLAEYIARADLTYSQIQQRLK